MRRRPNRAGYRIAGFCTTLLCLVACAVVVTPVSGHAQPLAPTAVADPVVTGPITGGIHGRPQFEAPFDISEYGYRATEYFISGIARPTGSPAAPAPYTTRIVVYRPVDPARFSGTVLLEWNNVTGQVDVPVEFIWAHNHIFDSGHAYVQVTVQQAGVCGMFLSGAPDVLGGLCTPTSLKGFDAVRYRPLIHPGDQYADDIFSQTARAIRNPGAIAPLDGLTAEHVVALGESQSAIALDNYIRAGADDRDRIIDGFLIDADGHTEKPAAYRVPTLTLWSEESARPAPVHAPNHATWSVAGAAHTDHWLTGDTPGWAGHSFLGAPLRTRAEQEAVEAVAGDYGLPSADLSSHSCAGNSRFPRRYAVDAALAALDRWVRTGIPAPDSPPLEFTGFRVPDPGPAVRNGLGALMAATNPELAHIDVVSLLGVPFAVRRDADGNALGGLRLPPISVPVSAYDGSICVAAGVSRALTPQRLRQLYPTHTDYVRAMVAATVDAVAQRFLIPRDARDLLVRACASAVPETGATPPERQPDPCGRLDDLPGL